MESGKSDKVISMYPGPPHGQNININYHKALRLVAILVLFVTFVGLDFLELGRQQTVQQVSSPAEAEADGGLSKNTSGLQSAEQRVSLASSVENSFRATERPELGSKQKSEDVDKRAERELSKSQVRSSIAREDEQDGLEVPAPAMPQPVESKPETPVVEAASGAHEWRGAPWKQRVGQWLSQCGGASALISVEEVVPGQECPGSCSGQGVCNRELGQCRCRHGYTGLDCGELDDYPCNRQGDEAFPLGHWIVSICAAHCDRRSSQCLCGPGAPFPDRPAVDPCGFSKDEEGRPMRNKVDLELLYGNASGTPGWCVADPALLGRGGAQPRQLCYCNYDGQAGLLCEQVTRAYCLGGCNRHGTCHMGYCQCEKGWYGIDCSIPSVDSPPEESPPLWLQPPQPPPGVEEEKEEEAEEEEQPSAGSARRLLGQAPAPGEGGAEPPRRRLAAGSRSMQRRRPLVYIYDLPLEYNGHHLQGRKWKYYCVPWMYDGRNATVFNAGMLYGMELAVYEALLASPHRTTNGEEADFFYVPVLTGCVIARADDSPRMSMQDYLGKRPYFMNTFVTAAYEHIRAAYPFWNRTEGRDHIWMFPWDEGACYAPQAIWNSVMLSPWGNTMAKHKASTTAYGADNWDAIPKEVRGDHPCFDPEKDIVLPNWKPPNAGQLEGRHWERPYEERPRLFYFNGNLGSRYPRGRPEAQYSMGIRQKVAQMFGSIPDIEGKLGERAEDGVVVTPIRSGDYATELASSRFCGVFPGDGFSARMEDSILHGCVPVIIQDGIQLPFENFLDYDSFAVRIAEDDIPHMVTLLKALSAERVRSLLARVRGLWQRWAYPSVVRQEARQQELWHGFREEWAVQSTQMTGDDAIATLIQILHYKLHNDLWRGASSLSQEKHHGIPETCIHTKHL